MLSSFATLTWAFIQPENQTLQHIWYDNIGSAEFDKCPIISSQLISAEIYDIIGVAKVYLYMM